MSCARCGCGIYKTEDFISLNKVWHTNCFTCYQCKKRLNKDNAKIFQGELFCQCCYSCVIEKLFEVISTPSVTKPCKVLSTPSCAVSKSFLDTIKKCDTFPKKSGCCKSKKKDYCFPAEKSRCPPKNVYSCSCIPSETFGKNEYCFVFPIPREVANYYNRSHMKSKARNPVTCCAQKRCPACSCRKCCNEAPEPAPKCQVRQLKAPCCCSPQKNSPPKNCCCSKPQPPLCTTTYHTIECNCCQPQSESEECESCPPPPPRCSPLPPCQTCQCCPNKPCKPKCPPPVCCPPPERCQTPPLKCCPPIKVNPPKKCCPPKMEGCNGFKPAACCCQKPKEPIMCLCRTPKYCVCGNLNPCNCKMSQIRQQCMVCCNRCGQKVYAAEKVLVSSGAYHTSCFTCYCCNKCLDVKTVYEGCGEIYCKHCYNHFFGIQYYGFGAPNY